MRKLTIGLALASMALAMPAFASTHDPTARSVAEIGSHSTTDQAMATANVTDSYSSSNPDRCKADRFTVTTAPPEVGALCSTISASNVSDTNTSDSNAIEFGTARP